MLLSKAPGTAAHTVPLPALHGVVAVFLYVGDPYQIFSFDFMHNWSLGVLQNIIRGMAAYADRVQQPGSSRHGTRALKALDQRLQQVPRVEGLTLPSTQQYFSDPAKITSTEHMAVQQVHAMPCSRATGRHTAV
jgi:hypothetical protein